MDADLSDVGVDSAEDEAKSYCDCCEATDLERWLADDFDRPGWARSYGATRSA